MVAEEVDEMEEEEEDEEENEDEKEEEVAMNFALPEDEGKERNAVARERGTREETRGGKK